MLSNLKKLINKISNMTEEGMLLKYAWRGRPNAQVELAVFYLKTQNHVEAYAWAELLCVKNIPGAIAIKKQAESLLKPSEIKAAWDLARTYKTNFA